MTTKAKFKNLGLIALAFLTIMLGSQAMGNAAEQPKPGGVFIVGLHADPDSLNPAVSSDGMLKATAYNLFSRLVYADQNGDYVGDLATSWDISDDDRTIRFSLRKGVKWHDGQPFNAEDVVFTMEKMAFYHPRGTEFKRAKSIKALDPYTVEIKYDKPSGVLFALLDESYMIPKHIYGTVKDLRTHPANRKPVGCGPFKFVEWKKGDHLTFVKNKDYYIPGQPYFDKVVFKIIASGESRALGLETGDIDYLASRDLPTSAVKRLRKDPNFVVTDKGMGASSLNILVFNIQRKPWDDVRVRRAIAHTIDRNVMAEKGTFGLAQPAYSPFSKRSWPWAYNPEVEKMYPYDLEKAGKLLDEAGYPAGADGMRIKKNLYITRGDSRSRDISTILVEQLKKVGIHLLIQPLDKPALSERVWMKSDFDVASVPSSQGSDPSIGVERMFITFKRKPVPSVHNANGYSDPEVDKLFLGAKTTMNLKKRGQYFRDVQLLIMRDIPILPLTDTPKFAAFPKKVKGVNQKSFWSFYNAPSEGWFSE